MADSPNYLLGYGERLTEKIDPVRRPVEKKPVYTFERARERLIPRVQQTAAQITELPDAACPHDECVAAVTLHPSYLAKTFFPGELLRNVGLEPVGSRTRQIIPEDGKRKPSKAQVEARVQPPSPTAEVFVAGPRRAFENWAKSIPKWTASKEHEALTRFEDVRFVPARERLKPMRSTATTPLLEVVLHRNDDYVLEGFRNYLRTLDLKVDLDRRIQVQNLCFLPVRIPRALHEDVAKFGFLRVAREMPSLRELRPGLTAGVLRSAKGFPAELPDVEPMSPELRVAVFDGGVPEGSLSKKLVSRRRAQGVGAAVPECEAHGLGVTSTILFGSLTRGAAPERPIARVEHYRVIDTDTKLDPQGQYFNVLNRIMNVLAQHEFHFVNLSLGPDLPIEDDEVHVWTASLDEHFSHGRTLVTVAVGNTGNDDWAAGNARIQAPADGVNLLAVGAADSARADWQRAPYSSVGPGRSPGLIKPDVLAFGGSANEPFWIPDANRPGHACGVEGTSFSSPLVLRAALAMRAVLGPVLTPTGLKALLIHHSELGERDQREVGWGRIPHDLERLVTCPQGTAHVIYQGVLEPGKYLRAPVPLPQAQALNGNIMIAATFCYATETDPQDPLNYTRAGLEISFRPDKTRFSTSERGRSKNPTTKGFFSARAYAGENELRRDAHKWEPCLKAIKSFRASSLNDPVFDIHYNARRGGQGYASAKPIPYALVVTVNAKHLRDLYNQIVQRYRTRLEPLRPVIQIPIRL